MTDLSGSIAASIPRTALVTGGARRLGRGITLALAEAGFAVAVHCHGSVADAERTAARCAPVAGAPPCCRPT